MGKREEEREGGGGVGVTSKRKIPEGKRESREAKGGERGKGKGGPLVRPRRGRKNERAKNEKRREEKGRKEVDGGGGRRR